MQHCEGPYPLVMTREDAETMFSRQKPQVKPKAEQMSEPAMPELTEQQRINDQSIAKVQEYIRSHDIFGC